MRDSAAYAHLWGTDELRAAFEDRARIQSWLDILAALAFAQAELGLIPETAAEEIGQRARIESLDMDFVISETRATSHSLLGLIRGAQKVLSPEAGEWFCYGATVQDVSDTWTVLSLRTMGGIAYRDLRAIEEALLRLAREHRTTPVAARTHGQPGLPIPFGFKPAVWASEVRRHLERLKEGRSRWLVGQLGGAVGTASIWEEQAAALQERPSGTPRTQLARWTARTRPFQLDDLRAEVGQQLATIFASHVLRQLEYGKRPQGRQRKTLICAG